jgi:hypothetical protein
MGVDHEQVFKLLEETKDPEERRRLMEEYKARTGQDLKADLDKKLNSGVDRLTGAGKAKADVVDALLEGKIAEAEAAKIELSTKGTMQTLRQGYVDGQPLLPESWKKSLVSSTTDEKALYKSLEGKSDAERKAIIEAYNRKYGKGDAHAFEAMLEKNLGGMDLEKAQLLSAKGEVPPSFAVKYAMDSFRTDGQAILKQLDGKSAKEVDAIRKDYNEKYGPPKGPPFDEVVVDKTSGRDSFQVQLALKYPEPLTPEQRIAKANEQYQFERGGAGEWIPGSHYISNALTDLISDDGKRLDRHQAELQDLARTLKESGTLTAEQQANLELLASFQKFDADRYNESKNTMATAVATVAAVVAGTVVTVLTGGVAGPIVGALIAGMVTIGTKMALAGRSYGRDDMLMDGAMTLVNAFTAGVLPGLGPLAGLAKSAPMLHAVLVGAIGGALSNAVGTMLSDKDAHDLAKLLLHGLQAGAKGAFTGAFGEQTTIIGKGVQGFTTGALGSVATEVLTDPAVLSGRWDDVALTLGGHALQAGLQSAGDAMSQHVYDARTAARDAAKQAKAEGRSLAEQQAAFKQTFEQHMSGKDLGAHGEGKKTSAPDEETKKAVPPDEELRKPTVPDEEARKPAAPDEEGKKPQAPEEKSTKPAETETKQPAHGEDGKGVIAGKEPESKPLQPEEKRPATGVKDEREHGPPTAKKVDEHETPQIKMPGGEEPRGTSPAAAHEEPAARSPLKEEMHAARQEMEQLGNKIKELHEDPLSYLDPEYVRKTRPQDVARQEELHRQIQELIAQQDAANTRFDTAQKQHVEDLHKALSTVPGTEKMKVVPEPAPLKPGEIRPEHAERLQAAIEQLEKTPTGRKALQRMREEGCSLTMEGIGNYNQGKRINLDPGARNDWAGTLAHEAHHLATAGRDIDAHLGAQREEFIRRALRNEAEAQAEAFEHYREMKQGGGKSGHGYDEYHDAYRTQRKLLESEVRAGTSSLTPEEIHQKAKEAGIQALEKIWGGATPSNSMKIDLTTGERVPDPSKPQSYEDYYGQAHDQHSPAGKRRLSETEGGAAPSHPPEGSQLPAERTPEEYLERAQKKQQEREERAARQKEREAEREKQRAEEEGRKQQAKDLAGVREDTTEKLLARSSDDPQARQELQARQKVLGRYDELAKAGKLEEAAGMFPPPTTATIDASRKVFSILEQAGIPKSALGNGTAVGILEVGAGERKQFIVSFSGSDKKAAAILQHVRPALEAQGFLIGSGDPNWKWTEVTNPQTGAPHPGGKECAAPKTFLSVDPTAEPRGFTELWYGPEVNPHPLIEGDQGHGSYMKPCVSCKTYSEDLVDPSKRQKLRAPEKTDDKANERINEKINDKTDEVQADESLRNKQDDRPGEKDVEP